MFTHSAPETADGTGTVPDTASTPDDLTPGGGEMTRRTTSKAVRQAAKAHREHNGSHVSLVCPPEWDFSPRLYRRLLQDERAVAIRQLLILGPLTLALVPLTVILTGRVPETDLWRMALFILGVFGAASGVGSVFSLERVVSLGGLPYHRLAAYDPARVLPTFPLDRDLRMLIAALVDVDEEYGSPRVTDPTARKARLTVAYESTARLLESAKKTGDYSLKGALKHCPDTIASLLEASDESPDSQVRQRAEALRAQMTLSDLISPGPALTARGGETPVPGSVMTTEQRLAARWAEAVQTHDRVSEEWGALVSDPLTALTHSALLDVTQSRTAAFVEAHGQAQYLRSLHGDAFPAHLRDAAPPGTHEDLPTVVREYALVVEKMQAAWTEAVRHAEHVAFDWLPAAEADTARRAASLLAVAADEAATFHERATAAAKAADLLKKVTSFLLPPAALTALEGQIRLELEAPLPNPA